MLKNKLHHVKEQPKRFNSNGHTGEFHQQSQKWEPAYKSPSFSLKRKGLIKDVLYENPVAPGARLLLLGN